MNMIMASFFLFGSIVPAVLLTIRIQKTVLADVPKRMHVLLLVVVSFLGIVLFARPHQDSFLALDTSDYRMMRQAFAAGRGLHEQDQMLRTVPPKLRRAFLLEYTFAGRDTSDLAFQLDDCTDLTTTPFFYPSLPLAELGLATFVPLPGSADSFVPLLGFLLFLATLLIGYQRGGAIGSLGVLALWLVSPLPIWCLRGAYAEAVGVALALLVALAWSCGAATGAWAAWALGFALSFHPLSAMLSFPLLAFTCFTSTSKREVMRLLVCFSLGVLPLFLMTLFVCQPYGNFLNPRTWVYLIHSTGHFRIMALVLVAFASAAWAAGVIHRRRPSLLTSGGGVPTLAVLLVVGAIVASCVVTPVRIGAIEAWHATRWGGIVLAILALLGLPGLPAPSQRRARALGLLILGLAPAFFALKGLEPTGLWSQRRLFPWVTLCVCAFSFPLAATLQQIDGRLRDLRWPARSLRLLLPVVLLAIGLSNALRWPAPWLGRFEKGSDAFIHEARKHFDRADLVVFDYHPYSVPFAVDNRSHVLGIGQQAGEQWPAVMTWLESRARTNELLFVSPWSLPGVEQGVALDPVVSMTGRFDRVRAKTSLPAITEPIEVVLNVARMRPLGDHSTLGPPPALDKLMDRGLAALRGPWGRADIRIKHPDGTCLEARWSRKGSALVGPLPPPGGTVQVEIEADACREDGMSQTLNIIPPWQSERLPVTISNGYSRVSAQLTRPATDERRNATGLYHLEPVFPYDPAAVGIHGFNRDLGALIHRVRIAPKP